MQVVSSVFLAVALALAVTIGPQMRPWTWGPAMMALGISVLAALPGFWRRGRGTGDFAMVALGTLTAGWFAWRAWVSPVAELGHADQLLLCGAVGAFLVVRGISGNASAERVLLWGVALVLGANLWVVAKQVADPSFTPLFGSRPADRMVTGFFAHYNYAANFMIASSLVLAAAGLLGRHATATRVVWLLLAAAGLAGVYFTKSRGGILGAAAACGVLAVAALILAKRRGSRWFAPAVVAVPLIGAGVAAFLIFGWEQRSGGDTDRLLDNDVRLYLLGIAASCIGQHPLMGGGSRSFSWECYQFIDNRILRHGGSRPEMAHNELMQAASDYGLLGSALLLAFLGALVLMALLRMSFEERPRELDSRDAWRAGGLAATAGVIVQSFFSFVFHLIPGAILLGLGMGQLSRTTPRTGVAAIGTRVLLTLACLLCAAALLPAGWKGSRVTQILWPSYFSKTGHHSPEAKIDALCEAIAIWPQSELLGDRARIFQEMAMTLADGPGFREPAELAVEDYLEAGRLHPYEPAFPINRANLLSLLARDAEAEEAFALGIRLQGGMESGFRGHFSLAKHYLRKSLRETQAQDSAAALASLELAAAEIENATAKMHWVIGDMHEPRLAIHESLGVAREQAGDSTGALAAYDFAATLRGGRRANYRSAVLIGKRAVDDWKARNPSAALAGFVEARRRVGLAAQNLPEGVTLVDRKEYIDYLDRMIAFLKGAKVQPAE